MHYLIQPQNTTLKMKKLKLESINDMPNGSTNR